MKVHYDRAAKLYVIPRADEIRNGTVMRGGPIYNGTLVGAIKRFMALSETDYINASIGFDIGTVEGNSSGLIGAQEIRAIFERPDFPH